MPVIIFLVIAVIFHIALKHTRYGKYIYAIGGNMTSARVSGINVNKYLVTVYTIAGGLRGWRAWCWRRVSSGQSSMGMSYELDAIAAAVIGGSSLMGGVGRITGTLIGAVILGLIKSGFTFIGVDSYIQDIIKGVIIVAAVSIDMRRNRKNTDCRELPPAPGLAGGVLPGTHHELPERAVAGGGAVRVYPGMGANHRRVDGLFRPELPHHHPPGDRQGGQGARHHRAV